MKKSRRVIILGISGGVILFSGLGIYFWQGPKQSKEQIIEIPLRSQTREISRKLAQQGLVRNATGFRWYVILTGQAKHLQAGEYVFPPGASLGEVARQLVKGQVRKYAITIPEGFTSAQIAEKLAQAGLVRAEAFAAVVQDSALAKAWHLPGHQLEGFLFPDTYVFTKGLSAEQIARRMVEQFFQKVSPDLEAAAQKQQLTFLQLVTLASIIEKEAKLPEERPLVASVFYNRLKQKMRLESCATVLYSQGRSSGALSLDDLNTSSPYNTYRHRGLPPGPIGNPGLSALQAAAQPAQTDYLFFVAGPDGRHIFSKDFETHKHTKWQQKRARQARDE